ncbi:MAG: hypothetical protein AB7U82_09030 [Blastocatellales bacterium]
MEAIPVRGVNLSLQFFHKVVVASLDDAINVDPFDRLDKRLTVEKELALFLIAGDLSQKHDVSHLYLFSELADHLRNLRSFFRRERLRENRDSLHIPDG